MQPRLTTLTTLNGRNSIEESVLSRSRNSYYEHQTPTKKSKPHYHPDSYKSRHDYYGNNKYSSFNKYNNSTLKESWLNHSTLKQADKFSHLPDEEKYASKKYQRNKTARPKPLQYENHKYYDLVFPTRKDSNSTDIFYRSNYYLEYAEL